MTTVVKPVQPVQPPLLPEQPLALGRVEDVLLERFPSNHDLYAGELPTPALVESIRRWGVLEPLLVRAVGGGVDYGDPANLVAGRRRLLAVRLLQSAARGEVARLAASVPTETLLSDATVPGYREAYADLARWHRIPARVISDPEGVAGDGRAAVLGLTSNAVRRANPVQDYLSIALLAERFRLAGLDERRVLTEIARATGLAVATIKQRLRLRDLTAGLLQEFLEGHVPYSVALAASRLGPEAQALLEEADDQGQRLTLDLVKEARRRAVQATQRTLFDDLPPATLRAVAGAPAVPVGLPVRAQETIETLRSTRLPVCEEAAGVIQELLEAREDALTKLEEARAGQS